MKTIARPLDGSTRTRGARGLAIARVASALGAVLFAGRAGAQTSGAISRDGAGSAGTATSVTGTANGQGTAAPGAGNTNAPGSASTPVLADDTAGGSTGGAATVTTTTTASTAPQLAIVPARPRWGHRNQVELRVGASEGYSLGIRYATGDPCSPNAGDHFCSARLPVLVDTALGFGVTQSLEIEARFRFGEPGWNQTVPLQAGIGARFYGDEFSRVKFFGGLAALVDFTGRGTAASYGTDLLARGEVGLQIEIVHEFAVYVGAGVSAAFLRALTLGIDGGLGVQVRVP